MDKRWEEMGDGRGDRRDGKIKETIYRHLYNNRDYVAF